MTDLVLLNLAGKDGCSQAYTLREKKLVERSFGGSYRSQHGGLKLKDSQLEIREVEKKIQVVEKKWKRGWLLPRRDA